MNPHALIDDARAALRHLAEVVLVAESALSAASELDRMWARVPWSLGIGGSDLEVRTALFNVACGERLFDPAARWPGGAALRVRRGAATLFRGLREDGSLEQGSLAAATQPVEIEVPRLRRELAEQDQLADARARALPVLLREPLRARWLRPLRWLIGLFRRRAVAAWRAAVSAADDTRRRLGAIEGSTPMSADLADRDRQLARLRELASRTEDLLEIELEVATGPLSEDIELLELTGSSRAAAEVDAVVVVAADGVYSPAIGETPSLRLGEPGDVIGALPELLAQARALRLARGVRDKLAGSVKLLEQAVASAEANFQLRLDRLEAMRIADPPAFAAAELARVDRAISASVHAVMEQASVHLGSELVQLASEWTGSITGATSSDELKTAAARIDDAWSGTAQRIANEVRILVMGGAGGSAHDLVPQVVGTLTPHGLQPTTAARPSPVLAQIEVLPSLAHAGSSKLGGTKQWLAGLFRSLDARRSGVHDKVKERIDHLREVASAELLDAEPKLHALIAGAVRTALDAGLDQQRAWLEAALATEHAAIAREREQLFDVIRVRDRAEHDLAWLRDAIERAELELPAVAAASGAASSLSVVFRPGP